MTVPVRIPIQLRTGRRWRSPEDRIAVRLPRLYRLMGRFGLRGRPGSRLRRLVIARAIRSSQEAYNRGDWEVTAARYDPGAVIIPNPSDALGVGVLGFESQYRGPGGMLEFHRTWREGWGEFLSAPCEVIDLGDRILMWGDAVMRGEGSGLEMRQPFAMLWTIEEGVVLREEFYFNHSDAMRAAGVDPEGSSP